jgi:hemerythrin-like domain-containing protein
MALVDMGIEALLSMHEGFRVSLDGFVDDLRAGRGIERRWAGFVRDLHDHHRHEDDEIYPQVRAVLGAEVAATFDAMDAEHETLALALDHADAAVVGEDDAAALEAVVALRDLVRDHLAHEEETAVPFIRRALDDEFMGAFFARRQAEAAAASAR